MEEVTEYDGIMLLPNEIMCMILQHLKCRDIIHFGSTCKKFNVFVITNQYIWKEKFREILPNKICDVVETYAEGNWLEEIKRFFTVRQKVFQELMAMSPKYYWRTNDLTLEDVQNFFDLALSDNLNYHYVIYILQDTIHQGTVRADHNAIKKPYTMTDVYYAKIVVRYLTQSFLTLRWVQSNLRKELTPEIVVNFFVQWTDPVSRHSDEHVKACIDILVTHVECMFPNDSYTESKECFTIQDKLAKGIICEKQVLEAISDVIYRQCHMTIMTGSSLHGLDIVKVLGNRCGNLIIAAVVYHTVARYCGVNCELIAFPNHLFLEWRNPMNPNQICKIDLENGAVVPQGRCPFAPNTFRKEYTFSPDAFLQYIVSAFLMTMGAIKNWHTQNTLFLLDFLSNNISDDNPYRDFLPFLEKEVNFEQSPELNTHLDLEFIPDSHLKILDKLLKVSKQPTQFAREVEVKERTSAVKFAVGMLAYQKKYDYLCVVRGWDLKCTTDWRRRVEFKDLERGSQQPFYSVIAVDQSERYVAQENLIHVDRPTRLYHLEDVIAKEFTHFDGFCYIPNEEKQNEYPQDEPVRNMYRSRAEAKAKELREAL